MGEQIVEKGRAWWQTMMTKYALLHDDECDVEVSGGKDQSIMAEVNTFLENFHPRIMSGMYGERG